MRQSTINQMTESKSNDNLTLPPMATEHSQYQKNNNDIALINNTNNTTIYNNASTNTNTNSMSNNECFYDPNSTGITLPPLEDMVGRIFHFKLQHSPTTQFFVPTTSTLPFVSVPNSQFSDEPSSYPTESREYYCDSQGRKIHKEAEKRGVSANTSPAVSQPISPIYNNNLYNYNYNSHEIVYISPIPSPNTHFIPIVPSLSSTDHINTTSHIAEYYCLNCGKEYEKCPHEQRCLHCHSRIRWRCLKCNITVAASQKSSHETSNIHNSPTRGSTHSAQSSEGYYCCAQCSRVLPQMPHSCCCTMCGKRIRWHCNVCQVEVDATGKTPHKKSLKHKRNSSLNNSLEDASTLSSHYNSNSAVSTPPSAEMSHSDEETEIYRLANLRSSEVLRNVIKIQPS